MTSPAIKLAKECGLVPDNTHPAPDTRHMKDKRTRLERFYNLAQAQALHQWAKEAEGYTNPLKLANDMDAAADELERKA